MPVEGAKNESGIPTSPGIGMRLLTGTISNSVGRLASAGTWFLLTPFILRELGPAGYGIWVLVGSFASYAYLLDLGIGGAVVKFVAEHSATDSSAGANRLIATASTLYLALGGVVIAASVLLASAFIELFDVPESQRSTAGYVILLTGLTTAVSIVCTPAMSILRGKQRYDLYNLVNAGGSLLTAVATVAVLLAGWGLVGMVAITVPTTLLMRLLALRMVRQVAPELRVTWRGADRKLLRKIMTFGSSSFAIFAANRLNSKSDELVIVTFLPISMVAPYAVSRTLSELARTLAEQFVKTIMPLASHLDARKDVQRLRTLFIVGSRLTLAALVPVALVLVLLAEPILTAWLGSSYASNDVLVIILTVAGVIGISQWSAQSIIEGMGQHRIVAVALLSAAAANVVLSIVLVRVLGLVGVALGTLIPTAIVSLGFILPYAMRVMQVGFKESVRAIWLPALLPAIPSAATVVILRHLMHPGTGSLLITAAAGGLIYMATYLGLGATNLERAMLRRVISSAPGFAARKRAG